jgi:hypothetical protein
MQTIQPAVVCMYLRIREYYVNCKRCYQIRIYLHLYPLCFLRLERIFVSVLMGHIFFHLILNVKMILTAQLHYNQKEVCAWLNTPEQTENNFNKNSLVLDNQNFKIYQTRISFIQNC